MSFKFEFGRCQFDNNSINKRIRESTSHSIAEQTVSFLETEEWAKLPFTVDPDYSKRSPRDETSGLSFRTGNQPES